jgi:hypothetical protein
MPIILTDASKLVVADRQPQKQAEEKEPQLTSLHPLSKGTVLLVNGKQRKIGKKSQYLLDMLTLED